jgi:hypothetical protein
MGTERVVPIGCLPRARTFPYLSIRRLLLGFLPTFHCPAIRNDLVKSQEWSEQVACCWFWIAGNKQFTMDARVAELADAPDLGSGDRKVVEVQVLSRVFPNVPPGFYGFSSFPNTDVQPIQFEAGVDGAIPVDPVDRGGLLF